MQSLPLFIESLGLTKKEAQIYLSCLQYGLVTATTLSRISKIPRSSIYEITNKLIKHGFIAQHKKQITTYFSATKPENLISILNNQKEQIEQKIVGLESHLDELRSLSQYSGQIPKVQYYEGQEALSFFFEQIGQAGFSYSVFDVESLVKSIYGSIEELAKHLVHEGVVGAKRIMTHSDLALQYYELVKDKNPNILRKILPQGYSMSAEMTLTEHSILHMSFAEKPTVIEITHPNYYQSHKMMFDFIRNRCK